MSARRKCFRLALITSLALAAAAHAEAASDDLEKLRVFMPPDQKAVLEAVSIAQQTYAGGENEMLKGASRPSRAKRLCAILRNGKAIDWIGTIYSLDSNGEGKGVLEVTVGKDTYVKTWNNSLSDMGDKTLLDPASPVFSQASKLKVGQTVRFSGAFFRSPTDCIKESSMSLSGSITEPEFIFRFQSVQPANLP